MWVCFWWFSWEPTWFIACGLTIISIERCNAFEFSIYSVSKFLKNVLFCATATTNRKKILKHIFSQIVSWLNCSHVHCHILNTKIGILRANKVELTLWVEGEKISSWYRKLLAVELHYKLFWWFAHGLLATVARVSPLLTWFYLDFKNTRYLTSKPWCSVVLGHFHHFPICLPPKPPFPPLFSRLCSF